MRHPVPSLADTLAHPSLSRASEPIRRPRVDAVDILRGLVMTIMMIDHVRDFTNAEAYQFDPTDVTRTNGILFFTRWITHFAAPTFVFLAGTSVYLQKMGGKPIGELSGFLVKRGLWLIFLELTVVKLVTWFTVTGTFVELLQVIWVIGVSMIVLAALVRFPVWVSAVFGIGMIALHNLTDSIRVATPAGAVPSATGKLWILLHQGGPLPLAGPSGPTVLVLYALIPWIGVMATGYAFGKVYEWDWPRRRKMMIQFGAGCIAAFLALRLANGYGDPAHWSTQPRGIAMTIVSFFNVSKYPPSLLFLLMTLGPAFLALAAFERWRDDSKLRNVLVTFGRVPLFYYMLQWITAHGAAVLLALAAGKEVAYLFRGLPDVFVTAPKDAGVPLWASWLVWITGVALLYPLCKWYAGVKARRKDWWISYT